jgi:hypothetical protein
MLENLVAELNNITGSPAQPYVVNTETGRYEAQIDNYHLSQAYGGVCLHRICNEHGGVYTPLMSSHVPKKELYEALGNYITGIEYGLNLKKGLDK